MLRSLHRRRLLVVGILLLTAWLYAPSLDFGFIWDDPIWFGRVVERPLLELIRPMSDFQFYRPGTMLYNRLFARPDGVFSAPLMHAAQIGWHLLNVALAYALVRRLGAARWTAVAVAGLVALYPFSHQAVAWAAPQQPLAAALQGGAWLFYLAAIRRRRLWPAALSVGLFLLALAVQESSVALAGLPLLLAWAAHTPNAPPGAAERRPAPPIPARPWRSLWRAWPVRLALVYPLAAAAFGLIWLQAPRQAGFTTFAPEREVLLYLLQGLVYPWAGRPSGYAPDFSLNPTLFLLAGALTIAVLLLLARRGGNGRLALLGLAWAVLGVAPALVGLSFAYVSLGARLLYYAAPGAALLWASALLSLPRRRRAAGALLLLFVAAQSGRLVWGFQQLYAVGAAHLAEMAATPPEAGQLYVNFPDRYAPVRPPFPVGYWGVTLAPVAVELGDFPALVSGAWRATDSRSLPWIGAEARAAGPYAIDMRGVITPPDELYRLAGDVERVYLSHYTPAGGFALQRAGSRQRAAGGAAACQVVFAQTACLKTAAVTHDQGHLTVTLTWLSLAPAGAHDTIFVHLGATGQPPLVQADGDAWLGMLPLAVWQPGDVVVDVRRLAWPPDAPAALTLSIGVYNRLAGARMPAQTSAGQPLPDDALAFTVHRP
jgi:hypothetical protein